MNIYHLALGLAKNVFNFAMPCVLALRSCFTPCDADLAFAFLSLAAVVALDFASFISFSFPIAVGASAASNSLIWESRVVKLGQEDISEELAADLETDS